MSKRKRELGVEDSKEKFEIGPVDLTNSCYNASFINHMHPYLVSVEPPMWVIDSSLVHDQQGAASLGDKASNWIPPFVKYVEAQDRGEWKRFNVANALHNQPERLWIKRRGRDSAELERLAGLLEGSIRL